MSFQIAIPWACPHMHRGGHRIYEGKFNLCLSNEDVRKIWNVLEVVAISDD